MSFIIDKIRGRSAAVSIAVAFFAVVIIVINLVFSVTTMRDRSDEVTRLELHSRELRELEHRGLYASGAMSLQAASARANREVEGFKKKLVDSKGLTLVLNDVFKAARRNGLTITSADYNPVTIKATDISRYFFSFPVEGRYRQVKKFIYDIENSKHMLVVESITMSSSKKARGRIGVDIELSAYFI